MNSNPRPSSRGADTPTTVPSPWPTHALFIETIFTVGIVHQLELFWKTFILVYVGTVTIGLSLRRDRVFYSRALLVLSANVRLGIALLKHRVT